MATLPNQRLRKAMMCTDIYIYCSVCVCVYACVHACMHEDVTKYS